MSVSRASLARFLLDRAFAPALARRPALDAPLTLSRRGFLGAGGGVAATVLGGVIQPLDPLLLRRGRIVIVILGSDSWTIDPARFGDRARAGWHARGKGFVVTLEGAVLPGTNLDVSFVAELLPTRAAWGVRLTVPSLRFRAAAGLREWMGGTTPLEADVAVRRIDIGGAEVRFDGASARFAVHPLLGFSFRGQPFHVALNVPGDVRGERLALDALAPRTGPLREASGRARDLPATACLIDAPSLTGPIHLGSPRDTGCVACSSDQPTMVCGEVFQTGSRREGQWLLEGALRMHAGDAPADGHRTQVRFEHAALLITSGDDGERVLAGRVARASFAIETAGSHFVVSGDDEYPFFQRFQPHEPVSFRVQARLERLWLPVPGAVESSASLPMPVVDLAFADDGPQPPDFERSQQKRGLILLGAGDAVIPLGDTEFTIRRGLDLFNLTYRFDGFDLKIIRGDPYLCRRPSPPGRRTRYAPAQVRVRFPPQHIAETFLEGDGGHEPTACAPPSVIHPAVDARLSSPSRVAFCVPDAVWVRQPFTIEALTEWADLGLLINTRARDYSDPPDQPNPDPACPNPSTGLRGWAEQLREVVGVTADTSADDLVRLVRATLQPPGRRETALVLSGRLLFSPSERAGFITPKAPPQRDAATLWHARLDQEKPINLRAVWSQFMQPGGFGVCTTRDPLLPLDPCHHFEIVAQTSVYGLPVLRRIEETTNPADDVVARALKDLPRSHVVRPDPPYRALTDIDPHYPPGGPDTGFAVPQPFSRAEVVMTSLGASVVAEWHGEPPLLRLQAIDSTAPEGFSVERLSLWSQIGRDIRVEVVKKGYVVPLGLRCSYVELTERRVFENPQEHYPTAYLVKRRFLVFGKPEKVYPGVNQPFESRDFPASRVRMITRRSPDLVNPLSGSDVPIGDAIVKTGGQVIFQENGAPAIIGVTPAGVGPCGDKGGTPPLIFWPRIKDGAPGSGGDVEFKWLMDDDPTPATSHLLFVENGALSVPATARRVARHYRELPAPQLPLRRVRLAGVRHRYAVPITPGETSFDSDSWLLSVRGRLLPATGGESEEFFMDGRMEGADQPPFYPIVEHAFVHVQSLDNLLGPQGLVQVAFNPAYVRDGFATSDRTKGEIYLNVVAPEIRLDVGGRGDTTGGVAKPSIIVVALSRKTGVVGGRRGGSAASPNVIQPASPLTPGFALDAAPPAVASSPYVFDDAQFGKFNPEEFFGVLDATLLGVINLKQVIRAVSTELDAAPKLLEQIGYGPADAAATVEAIAGRIAQALATIRDLARNLDALLKQEQQGVKPSDLYPALAQRASAFVTSIAGAPEAVRAAKDLGDVGVAVTPVVGAGRALIAELERTIQDPVPPVVEERLRDLASAWTTLKAAAELNYRAIGEALHREIALRLTGFCTSVGDELAPLLFGVRPEIDCAAVLDNPADVAAALKDALFARVFAEPLLKALDRLRAARDAITGQIVWARFTYEAALRERIRTAVEDMRTLIDPQAPIVKDTTEMARAIGTAANDLLRAASQQDPTRGVSAILDAIVADLPRMSTAIDRAIDTEKGRLAAGGADPPEAVLREFKSRIVTAATQLATDSINASVARVRADLAKQVELARARILQDAIEVVRGFVVSIASSTEFARIVTAARQLQGWCAMAAGQASAVVDAADDLAAQLMAPQAVLDAAIATAITAATQLTLPPETPSGIRLRFESSAAWAVARLQEARALIQPLRQLRGELATLRQSTHSTTAPPICSNPAIVLRPAAALLDARRQAIARLPEVARQLSDVARALNDLDRVLALPATDPGAIPQPAHDLVAQGAAQARLALAPLTPALRTLYTGATSIAGVVTNSWTAVEAHITALQNATGLASVQGYIGRLRAARDGVVQRAAALRAALASADMAALESLGREVLAYAAQEEPALAAAILQTVALTDASVEQLRRAVAAAARQAALKLRAPHAAALGAFQVVDDVFHNPIVALLVNPQVVQRFREAKDAIQADLTLVNGLLVNETDPTDPQDIETVLERAGQLAQRWGDPARPPAVVAAFAALADLIDHVLRGDLGAVVDAHAIRAAIESAQRELEKLLAQLVPTSIDLKYDWGTNLGSLGPFSMAPRSPDTPPETRDLTISARVFANVLTNSRDASVTGTLQPFDIKLLPGIADMATIHFTRASFKSVNGSAPTFDLQIGGVTIGPALEFLQKLQKWMSPDGGFYIRPLLNRPGIMAGYRFDADIISLGALNFLNVSLDVRAELPFSNDRNGARFKFSFASLERPFLISAPPYGGGGHVSLDANAKGIVGFSLSFTFGAVVPIKFGPLSAQGRLTAGVYLITTQDRRIVGALIEAVGEGHIACFGISVCIKVGLQDDNGNLTGWAEFSFEFKVGFFSIGFTIRASYTVHGKQSGGAPVGPGGGGDDALLGFGMAAVQPMPACIVGPATRTYKSAAPNKAREWTTYRKRMAMNLLAKGRQP